MKPYKFKMDDILNLRESREKKVMESLSQVQNSLREQIEDLKNLKNEITSINKNKYSTIQELRYQSTYRSNLRERVLKQNQLISSTRVEVDKVRAKLIEATRERKIMEKLKEEDKSSYERELRRVEQNELDEIAVLRFNASVV